MVKNQTYFQTHPKSQFFVVSKNNWWELLKDTKE
jgi:hypothetical protein